MLSRCGAGRTAAPRRAPGVYTPGWRCRSGARLIPGPGQQPPTRRRQAPLATTGRRRRHGRALSPPRTGRRAAPCLLRPPRLRTAAWNATHARTVTNGTQGQEGAPSRRSDTGEGAADAGSRGASGAQDSSAAAGANAEVPREGARPSGLGRGEGAAQSTSRPRGLDHAEASAAIAGGPRPPDRAGAGGYEGKPAAAGPPRRAGKQKSDAERAEEVVALSTC